MRATIIHGAGDIRVEEVPDPQLREPTDAVVRVVRACICGSDLWPYRSMPVSEHGERIGHEFLGVVEDWVLRCRALRGVIWSSPRSSGLTTPATSVERDSRPPAGTAGCGPATASTAARAKRYGCPRRKEPW